MTFGQVHQATFEDGSQSTFGYYSDQTSSSETGVQDRAEQASEDTQSEEESNVPTNNSEPDTVDPGKVRAVIYARVSTDGQKRTGRSLESQVRHLKEALEEDDDAVLVEDPIKDGGKTGTDFSRKGIRRIFYLAKQGEIDRVYVTKLNRIGRCAPETLYFMYILQNDLGVTFATESEHLDISNNLDHLLVSTIRLLSGHFETENRVTESIRSQIEQFENEWDWFVFANRAPLGYERSTDREHDNWIQVCEDEVPIVRAFR